MSKRLYVKYPLFLSDFSETWIFSTDFRKRSQISSFIKIRPEFLLADGRTADLKLLVTFRNFANAPKISNSTQLYTYNLIMQ
jgi:hypothetical protein